MDAPSAPPANPPTPTTTTVLRPRPPPQQPKAPKPPPLPRASFLRLSHLYQLSHALTVPTTTSTTTTTNTTTTSSSPSASPTTAPISVPPLARFYLTTMRSLSHKSVLRLSPAIKRTVCKRCDTLLVPGVSCTGELRNASRGGKKRAADVWVVGCTACGAEKRFPVGQGVRKGKKDREGKGDVVMKEDGQGGEVDEEEREGGYRLWSEREDVVIPDVEVAVTGGNSAGQSSGSRKDSGVGAGAVVGGP